MSNCSSKGKGLIHKHYTEKPALMLKCEGMYVFNFMSVPRLHVSNDFFGQHFDSKGSFLILVV